MTRRFVPVEAQPSQPDPKRGDAELYKSIEMDFAEAFGCGDANFGHNTAGAARIIREAIIDQHLSLYLSRVAKLEC